MAEANGHLPRATIEGILAADDIREEVVDLPEWGGSFLLRSLTKARGDLLKANTVPPDDPAFEDTFQKALLVATVVEPELSMEQVDALEDKAYDPYMTLVKAVLDINGMSREVRQRAKTRFPT